MGKQHDGASEQHQVPVKKPVDDKLGYVSEKSYPDPVVLTMEWLEQGRSPHPQPYRCNSTAKECGIPIAHKGINIDLRPYLELIIAKSVFQDKVQWTYSATELAFILNVHSAEWDLTRRYSPATIGKHMKQLFNDPNQVHHPAMDVVFLDQVNISRDTKREPKRCRDGGTQLQHFYTFYIPWNPEDSTASRLHEKAARTDQMAI